MAVLRVWTTGFSIPRAAPDGKARGRSGPMRRLVLGKAERGTEWSGRGPPQWGTSRSEGANIPGCRTLLVGSRAKSSWCGTGTGEVVMGRKSPGPEGWPEFDDPLLREVAASFLHRRKAL